MSAREHRHKRLALAAATLALGTGLTFAAPKRPEDPEVRRLRRLRGLRDVLGLPYTWSSDLKDTRVKYKTSSPYKSCP
ncbi:hypothetical protein AT728_07780 [Streptomyces silvensis]|uniref:Uncharacterized protein n=2 Tax=Streptomyces silvensis TaxID=1765722 RepID=A0A0W7X8H3_9ACTN|nr:hypothetical protein AT728_07780 [Streptomyces silvensis]